MRYVIENNQVKDTVTNSFIDLNNIEIQNYTKNKVLYNTEEDQYYLAAINYLYDFETGDLLSDISECCDEYSNDSFYVYKKYIYYFVEVYTLPDLKFVGFIPSINYYDFDIIANGIVDLKHKIVYVPTRNGIIQQNY